MKKIFYLILPVIFILFGFLYYADNNFIAKKIKFYAPPNIKQSIKNTLFFVPETRKKTIYLSSQVDQLLKEVAYLKQQNNLSKIEKIKNNNLDIYASNFILDKYRLTSFNIPFSNYKSSQKAAFYISVLDKFIYLVSGTGEILKLNKEDLLQEKTKPKLIASNIKEIIKDPRHFDIYKNSAISGQISIKDSKIINNTLYLSYNKELKKDCYNTSIIFAEINNTKLIFEEFFSFNKCISRERKGIKPWFWGQQSGGRMVNINDKKMLFTIGEYRARTLAQDDKSLFGKIIEIDLKSKKYNIFSKGHRNPQGLFYLQSKNKILSTEHGPYGGDELNIIKKDGNYGWPISSYGRHYDNTFKKEAPLYKSHKEYGYKEPLFYWNKISSTGVSQIVHIGINREGKDLFLVGSLRAKKLFFFEVSKDYLKAKLYKTININERVRDIVYDKNFGNIYLALENTPKLIIMSPNKFDYY